MKKMEVDGISYECPYVMNPFAFWRIFIFQHYIEISIFIVEWLAVKLFNWDIFLDIEIQKPNQKK